MTNFDMHFHTNSSDWKNTIDEMIDYAKKENIWFLALTDHDVISNPEIFKQNGIDSCFSTEISARDKKNNHSLHITWYCKYFNEELNKILENTRNSKKLILEYQVQKLQKLWLEIDMTDLEQVWKMMNRSIDSLNKYDIAIMVFQKKNNIEIIKEKTNGKVNNYNAFYLEWMKETGDFFDIFWLPHWVVEEYEPSLELCWEISKKTNSILSIAHPNFSFERKWDMEYLEKNIKYFIECWINAIEINAKASKEWVDYIYDLEKRFWIIITTWSDCHYLWQNDSKHSSLWNLNQHLNEEQKSSILLKVKKRLWI